MNKISRLFQPLVIKPKNAEIRTDLTAKSQRLMIEQGIVRPGAPGSFHLLPLGERSLRKLTSLVDKYMLDIGAQKIYMPTISTADLWKTTGRLEGSELFTLKDRHDRLHILSPTHEETVTALIASLNPVSYRQFPIRLYQIGHKYRDEIKPRFGLLRAREFIMKDLYTFDTSVDTARDTYEEVNDSYKRFFDKLGVSYVKVKGDTGSIGGTESHEYHFPSDIGEDTITLCAQCGFCANTELMSSKHCPVCNKQDLTCKTGIEVGHTFLLGEKYSKPLKAQFLHQNGKPYNLQMGCYGLGISRIIAAALEVMSTETELRWPLDIAPYLVCLIPPKKGSKEASIYNDDRVKELYKLVTSLPGLSDEVIVDDRTEQTIGKRLLHAKSMGYPYIIVAGKDSIQQIPLLECHSLNTNQLHYYTELQVFELFKESFFCDGKLCT